MEALNPRFRVPCVRGQKPEHTIQSCPPTLSRQRLVYPRLASNRLYSQDEHELLILLPLIPDLMEQALTRQFM